jgi:hypothetical protein
LVLSVIVLMFLALASVIALKTPAWESSDESDHVENVEALVSGHWYGMNSKCGIGAAAAVYCTGTEPQQAPLYYLLLAGWQRATHLSPRVPSTGPISTAYFRGSPSLYKSHTSSDHRFLLWLRLPNVLIGVLTIIFSFLAVRVISHDRWTPVVAAALVAFLPHFVFLSAFVTNDNLANLFGAIFTFACLRYVVSSTSWRIAWVGIAFGALVVTKLSALPFGIVVVTVAVVGSRNWSRRFWHTAVAAAASLLISGWYLIQNTYRYGDPLASKASAHYLAQVGGIGTFFGAPYVVNDPLGLIFVQVPTRMIHSFWYQSDWNAFHWPMGVDVAFLIVSATALVGLVGRHVERRALLTLGLIAASGLASVWIIAFQTATYEAKYALVGLPAMAALVAMATERWKPLVRFLLPLAGLIGTVIAIQTDVLAVRWP